MRNTHAAVVWIVSILQELNIPFEIDGGLAAHIYGAARELADIDINVPQERFEELVPHIREYLHFGPSQYKDEHWDLYMMTVNYAGQNIDISALGNMRYYDHETNEWKDFPSDMSDVRNMAYDNMDLPFVNEIKLMIYKQQLGRGVDRKDVRMMEDQLFKESPQK